MEGASLWTFMLAVGVAAVALLYAGMMSVTSVLNPLRRRLRALRSSDDQPLAAATASKRTSSGIWRVFEPSKESDRVGIQLQLQQAGFRSPSAVGMVYSLKVVGAVLTPIAAFAALRFFPEVHLDFLSNVALGLVAVFVGLRLPDKFLQGRADSRRQKIMEGLPDALDLLVTCTEAGLGLNAALERVVEQLPASHPELAQELGLVNAEVRAGIDRNAALKNLSERTGLEEIHGLVSLITHSSRLGTGIAGTLRIYADDFRDRRMQRAEEFAATVGTKLIFPLLLCLWPSFFIVAVGPSILNLMKFFGAK